MGEYSAQEMEILDHKAVKALREEIGDKGVKDFLANTNEQLKAIISNCHMQIEEAKAKTADNKAYQEAKAVIKDFSSSLREQNKPLKQRIEAATFILRNRK